MRVVIIVALFASTILGIAVPAHAQDPRLDVLWARRTSETITLDGVLSEPGWAVAESLVVHFAQDNGIPGSGWKYEAGFFAQDPTRAVIKFLVKDNQLYMGAWVPDKTVGGSEVFNRFDGFLMALKDHASPAAPKWAAEYFYSWWYEGTPDPQPTTAVPSFVGRWATWPPGTARTQEQIDNWDAVTVVNGVANEDTIPGVQPRTWVDDAGYTIEMRFNLTPMGYDTSKPGGEVIEWNVSIYDCDWFWPVTAPKFSSNRVWVQSPWGNTAWYSEVQIHTRPGVTVSNNTLPFVGPETYVPDGSGYPTPVIDGNPNESVWADLGGTLIEYGNDALRLTYDGVGPYRAGQFQPTVNGGQAAVLDPGYGSFKMFHKNDWLYMSFDVNDQVVQYHTIIDRWDGWIITVNDRVVRDVEDQVLKGRRLSFQVAANGSATPQDYLLTMVNAGDAQVAIQLKPGTTVDTLGVEPDAGYTAEVAIDLTALGYPAGLGDRILFIGMNLLDGDSFENPADSYGTRTWWYREYEGQCCPAWSYLAPAGITGIEDPVPAPRPGYALLGAYPNPAPATVIRFALPELSSVSLEVFDAAGRLVAERTVGVRPAGTHDTRFDGAGLSDGLYFYRLRALDPHTGAVKAVLNGRVMILK